MFQLTFFTNVKRRRVLPDSTRLTHHPGVYAAPDQSEVGLIYEEADGTDDTPQQVGFVVAMKSTGRESGQRDHER